MNLIIRQKTLTKICRISESVKQPMCFMTFSGINTVRMEIDVNLLLIGFDKYNKDFSSIQNGLLEKLSDFKPQRFLKVDKSTTQEKEGSFIEYTTHYHFIQVHPMVQVYLRHLMETGHRNIDVNLMNIKVINPFSK